MHNSAADTAVINTRPAVGSWEVGSNTLKLSVGEPVMIGHGKFPPAFLNHRSPKRGNPLKIIDLASNQVLIETVTGTPCVSELLTMQLDIAFSTTIAGSEPSKFEQPTNILAEVATNGAPASSSDTSTEMSPNLCTKLFGNIAQIVTEAAT